MSFKFAVKVFAPVLCTVVAILGGTGLVFADSGPDHQALQARPISLGTSGGNINDISTLYCCSGTLGALVRDSSGVQYILSNNHVLARSNLGNVGDPVNQPGMIDQNCAQTGIIANLSDFMPLQFSTKGSTPLNQMDAAIARVTTGSVKTDGAILDIGAISSGTRSAFVNQSVQKSGRTTGRTTGTVTAIDVTVDIGYSNTCGGASNKKARFVNQINITPGTFSAGGDSGSLILENGTVNPADGRPRAVGLLFAGSSSSTIANPIGPVLATLGVSMVGGAPVSPSTGSIAGLVLSAADGAPIAGATVSVSSGQSALTELNGAYTVTGVPTGTRTVTASAAGYLSSAESVNVVENATASADFLLDEAVSPTSVGVGCVTYTTTGSRGRDLQVTVRALDNFGNAVAGARVAISITLNGSAYATGSGATTNSTGQVSYTAKNAPNGTYVTTVTSIVSTGLTFNAGSTPVNSFRKGTAASPSSFCNTGATPLGVAMDSARQVDRARAAKARNSDRLFGIAGVQGHGVARGADGQPVIEVYIANENAARAQIPSSLENIPVRVVVSGEFKAY